jgi:hypothetical protein
MDTRTRWIVGILVALVIGLGVGLIIVAADNSKDTTTTVRATSNNPGTERLTEPTTTSGPTTSTAPNGGTPVPGGTTTPGGGSGGL